MNQEDKPYPTDEFGRPNGRNYHYRIPLDDSRAMRKARIAEKIKGRVLEWDCCDDNPIGYTCVQTHDNKGPISGLGEYEYSKQWERPFGPGKYENLRIRYNNGGGTKIKGSVWTCDEYGTEYQLPINTAVDLTVGEVKDAIENCGDKWNQLLESIQWAIEDSLEEKREKEWQKQQECSHDHVVVHDERKVSHSGLRVKGYCEDCNKEFVDSVPESS